MMPIQPVGDTSSHKLVLDALIVLLSDTMLSLLFILLIIKTPFKSHLTQIAMPVPMNLYMPIHISTSNLASIKQLTKKDSPASTSILLL